MVTAERFPLFQKTKQNNKKDRRLAVFLLQNKYLFPRMKQS